MVELHGYKIFVSIWHPYPFVFPQRGGEPWLLWLPPKYVPVLLWQLHSDAHSCICDISFCFVWHIYHAIRFDTLLVHIALLVSVTDGAWIFWICCDNIVILVICHRSFSCDAGCWYSSIPFYCHFCFHFTVSLWLLWVQDFFKTQKCVQRKPIVEAISTLDSHKTNKKAKVMKYSKRWSCVSIPLGLDQIIVL